MNKRTSISKIENEYLLAFFTRLKYMQDLLHRSTIAIARAMISCTLTSWRVHASDFNPGFVTFVGKRKRGVWRLVTKIPFMEL
jgi:hypothetical protein